MDTVNPYKKLREDSGIKISEINLPEKTIRDLESFKYDLINVKVHEAYGNVFGGEYNGPKIIREYNEKKLKLRKAVRLPSLKDVSFSRWNSGHPLYYYINRIGHTITSFCNLIYLREENLSTEKLKDSGSIQPIIKDALAQCGMPQNDITTLKNMSRLYINGVLPTSTKNEELRTNHFIN